MKTETEVYVKLAINKINKVKHARVCFDFRVDFHS